MGPFIKRRLFPVALLWTGVLFTYVAAGTLLQAMAADGRAVNFRPVALESFADGHLVAALSLGTLSLMGFFSLVLMNVSVSGGDQTRVLDFLYRVWDEVSSASTHVGCALAVSATYLSFAGRGSSAHWLDALSVACYILFGFLAFRFEDPASAASVASTPAANAIPLAGPAPALAPAASPVPTAVVQATASSSAHTP